MDEVKNACKWCNTEYDIDELREHEGDYVCVDCSNYCESCNVLIYSDDTRWTDDSQALCDSCSFSCDRCDSYDHSDNSQDVNDGESWCGSCYENRTWHCESCSTTYSDSYDYTYVQDQCMCESCYASNAWYCDDCNEHFFDDQECDCGNTSGVRSSATCSGRGACGTGRAIHQYGCKPDVVFHGVSKQGLYLGLELETEIRRDLSDASRYASEALKGVAILKHDGSIGHKNHQRVGDEGFEIVTQPHTHHEYRYNSQALWDTIDNLRVVHGARAWDAKSDCGIHIHISRAGFSSGAHTHRFMSLIYKNSEHMMKFAGRKSDYARFNDCYTFDEYDKPVFSLKHKVSNPDRTSTERFSAVNTQNRDTIELRFFRGTMNSKGVLATLDMAHAMVEYTRNLRLDDVKLGALSWEWFVDWVSDNNGIYPDLYNRIHKIGAVRLSNPELLEA